MLKWFFDYLYWFQIFKDQCLSVLSIPVACPWLVSNRRYIYVIVRIRNQSLYIRTAIISVIIYNDRKKFVCIYNDQLKPVLIYNDQVELVFIYNDQHSSPSFHKQTSFFI
jgi:hypothetical protein